jgi:hypothetical protein
MSVITIGIQTIMPKTATTPQDSPPQPESASARYTDNAALVADAVAKQAPPLPGTGQLLDKTV